MAAAGAEARGGAVRRDTAAAAISRRDDAGVRHWWKRSVLPFERQTAPNSGGGKFLGDKQGMSISEDRLEIEAFFGRENLIADWHESAVSPSGRYRLDVDEYRVGPQRGYYSRGIVRRVAGDSVLADVKRNYDFWHAWVPRHPSGDEYLLCGEDYQGYTVINLDRGVVANHLPPEARRSSARISRMRCGR
jgi:hypothetical protein